MRHIISKYSVLLLVISIAGAVLFQTSQAVQNAEQELRSVKRDIAKERDNIAMLEAEWAALNSPYRLEMLAKEYLDMDQPRPDSMMPRDASAPADHKQLMPIVIPKHHDVSYEGAVSDVHFGIQNDAQPAKSRVLKPAHKPALQKVDDSNQGMSQLLKKLVHEGAR